MSNLSQHLNLIRLHRKHVRKACFKMGIPIQGLLHDLSKYSLTELKISKYFVGTYSPHDAARKSLGYSPSWYHHRNRNKHHSEYWVDSFEKMNAVKMPYKYVIEMFCDFIAAGKAYNKDKWSCKDPYRYWIEKCQDVRVLHPDTKELFEQLLRSLYACEQEADFYTSYKSMKKYLKRKYEKDEKE